MALPTGTITMNDVRTELSKTSSITLNDSDVRVLAGKTSGTISMNDLRGKTNTIFKLTPAYLNNYGKYPSYGYSDGVYGEAPYGSLTPERHSGYKIHNLEMWKDGAGYYLCVWTDKSSGSFKVSFDGKVSGVCNDSKWGKLQDVSIYNYLASKKGQVVTVELIRT